MTDMKTTDHAGPSVDAVVTSRTAQPTRPPTTPAYYLGRPAEFWIATFRCTRMRAKAEPERRLASVNTAAAVAGDAVRNLAQEDSR